MVGNEWVKLNKFNLKGNILYNLYFILNIYKKC